MRKTLTASLLAFSFLVIPALGSAEVFHLTNPQCRVADSRKLSVNQYSDAFHLSIKNASLIAAQGGDTNCIVPANAVGVSLTFTTISEMGGLYYGHLTAYPYSSSLPGVATMIFQGGAELSSSPVTVPVCSGACVYDISTISTQPVVLIVDLVGYYTADALPIANTVHKLGSAIDPDGKPGTASPSPFAGCSMDPNGCQDSPIGDCCPDNDSTQCPARDGYARVVCGFPMCADGHLSCLYFN